MEVINASNGYLQGTNDKRQLNSLKGKDLEGIDCEFVTTSNLHSVQVAIPGEEQPKFKLDVENSENEYDHIEPSTCESGSNDRTEISEAMFPSIVVNHYPIKQLPTLRNTLPKTANCCCNCHCGASHRSEFDLWKNEQRSSLSRHRRSSPNIHRRDHDFNQSFGHKMWTFPTKPTARPYKSAPASLVIANSNNNRNLPENKPENNVSNSVLIVDPTGDTTYGVEETPVDSKKVWLGCCVLNTGLLMLVITLIVITLSTLAALIYFVVFGNSSGNVGGTNSSNASSLPSVPNVDKVLNQTLYCGVYPSRFLPRRGVNSRSFLDPSLPISPRSPENDTNSNVTGRVIGSTPASILQYPWQATSSGINTTTRTVSFQKNRVLSVEPRVMGGGDSPAGKFPWQVSLWATGRGMTCGGAIILKNWVLTAAHCTAAKPKASSWTAYVGMSALSLKDKSPAQKREVMTIVQSPLYDDITFDYDVSLMRLKGDLVFTDYVQPICIPPPSQVFPAGMACYVSGWGELDDTGTSPHPDVLQHAQIDIISNDTCSSPDWLHNMVTDRMLCAGKINGKRDACQGDSGGPLSCYVADQGVWMLAGSVSWGIGCGQPKLPGVYARMTFFSNWIWTSIGDNDPSFNYAGR